MDPLLHTLLPTNTTNNLKEYNGIGSVRFTPLPISFFHANVCEVIGNIAEQGMMHHII